MGPYMWLHTCVHGVCVSCLQIRQVYCLFQDGLPKALWSALPPAQRADARPTGNLQIHFFGTLIKPGDQDALGGDQRPALQRVVGGGWLVAPRCWMAGRAHALQRVQACGPLFACLHGIRPPGHKLLAGMRSPRSCALPGH